MIWEKGTIGVPSDEPTVKWSLRKRLVQFVLYKGCYGGWVRG